MPIFDYNQPKIILIEKKDGRKLRFHRHEVKLELYGARIKHLNTANQQTTFC